jgi:hypothetical protein
VTFVLGASGWGFTWLLFEPTKEIMNLRREAQEYLIFHGNLEKKDVPPEERRTASDAFRRIGAGLVSRYAAVYRWVRPIWLWLGWNIHFQMSTPPRTAGGKGRAGEIDLPGDDGRPLIDMKRRAGEHHPVEVRERSAKRQGFAIGDIEGCTADIRVMQLDGRGK